VDAGRLVRRLFIMMNDDKTGMVRDKEDGGRFASNRTDEQQPHSRRCRSIQKSLPCQSDRNDDGGGGIAPDPRLGKTARNRASKVLTVVALFYYSSAKWLDLIAARRTIFIVTLSYGKQIIVAVRQGTHFQT
jgi:hypothetical protein